MQSQPDPIKELIAQLFAAKGEKEQTRILDQIRELKRVLMKGADRRAPLVHRRYGKPKPKRYAILCQTEPKKPDRTERWVKYHCNDLLKMTAFLDANFPRWCFFNVFSNRGPNKGTQLDNFTRTKRPQRPHL